MRLKRRSLRHVLEVDRYGPAAALVLRLLAYRLRAPNGEHFRCERRSLRSTERSAWRVSRATRESDSSPSRSLTVEPGGSWTSST